MTHEGSAGALNLRRISKWYGNVVAVNNVSLEVLPGEFISLLGPSGSGKTTTLRIIAGFIRPDSGQVILDGQDLSGAPPYERDIGMVFQNYALFPHMTAVENIAFPLEMRQTPRAEIRTRVQEALNLVRLAGLGSRYPHQLSGGQQQRVALARALVFRPRLLLMDEPMGALDKKLREALQLEIMQISRRLGVTVIYVTHDQEEALVMSDRIAVFNHGRIEQLGSGEELYELPTSLFVADFIGESNFFRGALTLDGEGGVVVQAERHICVSRQACERVNLAAGSRAMVVVRPEWLLLQPAHSANPSDAAGLATVLSGVVREVIYLGSTRKYVLDLEDGTTAIARTQVGQMGSHLAAGEPVQVSWRTEHGVLVADEGGSEA